MFAIWASPTVALYFGLSSTVHYTHCFCICMIRLPGVVIRLPGVVVRGCGQKEKLKLGIPRMAPELA
jgi:hypothetical protein